MIVGCVPRNKGAGAWDAPYDILLFIFLKCLIINNILKLPHNWHINEINGLRGKSDGLPAYLFLENIFFQSSLFCAGIASDCSFRSSCRHGLHQRTISSCQRKSALITQGTQ